MGLYFERKIEKVVKLIKQKKAELAELNSYRKSLEAAQNKIVQMEELDSRKDTQNQQPDLIDNE